MGRKLTPREINHLLKNNIDPFSLPLDQLGEKPVEYISGTAEFLYKSFYINQDTLIPRPESEILVQGVLEEIKNSDSRDIRVAEIGTGSGAIGLSLAFELLHSDLKFELFLTDISIPALKVAKRNLMEFFQKRISSSMHSKTQTFEFKVILDNLSKIQIFYSDLLINFLKEGKKLNYIVANLPYIPSSRFAYLDNSVKKFEPRIALDGGEDGFKLIFKLLQQARKLLAKKGKIFLEVDDIHTGRFIDLYNLNEFWSVKIINDDNKKNRFWILEKI